MMLTRRTATVTTSAPEASIAFWVSTKSLYLPVPTHRRDRNSTPAMVNLSSFMRCLASADKPDDLDSISISKRRPLKGATVYNLQIHLHRHSITSNLQLRQERRHRAGFRHIP